MLDREDATPKGKPAPRKANARMRASGNAIFTDKARQQAADLKSRNAYRAAIGLPLIVPGKE